jgi:hypothetical protein
MATYAYGEIDQAQAELITVAKWTTFEPRGAWLAREELLQVRSIRRAAVDQYVSDG